MHVIYVLPTEIFYRVVILVQGHQHTSWYDNTYQILDYEGLRCSRKCNHYSAQKGLSSVSIYPDPRPHKIIISTVFDYYNNYTQ